MTTTMTADQRERIVLLEQRQQLRQLAVQHYSRAQAELHRFHEDLIRCEVLFADRMELEAIGSFRTLLTAMAARWREEAATTRYDCAEQIEALLHVTKAGEPHEW